MILGLCLAACAAAAAPARGDGKEGKARPDFSGTWELDHARSSRGGSRSVWKNPATLVIEHRGEELRIKRTLELGGGRRETKEFTYYTDGRGEVNPMALGAGRSGTKTKWEGARVVSYAYYGATKGFGGDLSDTAFKWRLSDDGRTLTHTIQSSVRPSVGGGSVADTINSETKLVFRRVG
jgi:hypothetical protein